MATHPHGKVPKYKLKNKRGMCKDYGFYFRMNKVELQHLKDIADFEFGGDKSKAIRILIGRRWIDLGFDQRQIDLYRATVRKKRRQRDEKKKQETLCDPKIKNK